MKGIMNVITANGTRRCEVLEGNRVMMHHAVFEVI